MVCKRVGCICLYANLTNSAALRVTVVRSMRRHQCVRAAVGVCLRLHGTCFHYMLDYIAYKLKNAECTQHLKRTQVTSASLQRPLRPSHNTTSLFLIL